MLLLFDYSDYYANHVPEIICPSPEDVYDTYVVTKVPKYTLGSEVTYVCLPGKRFSNGKINRTVTCGVNEQWSHIIDNCTGGLQGCDCRRACVRVFWCCLC